MREAAARLPSRAATRAVPASCDPVWNEVVTVEARRSEPPKSLNLRTPEKLYILKILYVSALP
jgi:hypothetical protein